MIRLSEKSTIPEVIFDDKGDVENCTSTYVCFLGAEAYPLLMVSRYWFLNRGPVQTFDKDLRDVNITEVSTNFIETIFSYALAITTFS